MLAGNRGNPFRLRCPAGGPVEREWNMKRKQTPTAGKADTKSAPQPADPLLLADDTPYVEGQRPDGTTWKALKPANTERPASIRPKSVAQLREWCEGRRSLLLDSSDAVLKVWPQSIADLLDGARSLGLTPPQMRFPATSSDRQELLDNLDTMLSWLEGTEGHPATDAAKPDESAAETVDHKGPATVKCKRKRVKVNDRMAAELLKNPDSCDWSTQQWADHLGCSKSTISVTPQFKALLSMRVGAHIERQVKKAKIRK